MALTTDARKEITAALTAANLPAFPYLPATVSLPAVIITPRDPYVIPDRIGRDLTYTANFRVSMLAQALDNESGLAACEELIDRTMAAMPDGVLVLSVSPPLIDDLGAQGSAYVAEMDVSAHVTGAVPPPAVPLPPTRETQLPVDLYANSFIRVGMDDLLDDGQEHWVEFVLAVAPGINGAVLAGANDIASHAGVAWFDHNGTLGHIRHSSEHGADVTTMELSNYVRQHRLALVVLVPNSPTDNGKPVLIIHDLFNPNTH